MGEPYGQNADRKEMGETMSKAGKRRKGKGLKVFPR